MPCLLIVEDDRNLALSLAQGFGERGFDVTVAGGVGEARRFLARGGWDLLVLDLGLPDGDGFELVTEGRGRSGMPPVLITTARGGLDEKLRGLEGGADDYLVKPYAFAELLARVRLRLRRGEGGAAPVLRAGDLEVDPVVRRAWCGSRELELTPHEFGILAQLVLGQGEVVTREQLARIIWRSGGGSPSLDNVIDVHVSRLRRKLETSGAEALLRTVRGVGFMLGGP